MNSGFQPEQLRKGDPNAFRQLFHYYGGKLYAFAFSYLKDEVEAEEVVQDVFYKLWKNHDKLQTDKSIQSYLFTIAFNSVKKAFLRKSKDEAYKHALVDELDSMDESGDFEQRYQTVLQKLDLFIEEMPERRRQIFIARKREGKSQKQIAEEMGISVKTVENQITEAMKFLKLRFEQELPDGIHLLTFVISF